MSSLKSLAELTGRVANRRGIYYMLEPMLIMLTILAVFAVPVIQTDRLENARLLELQANDVVSVMFQDGTVDEMVKGCDFGKQIFSNNDALKDRITARVRALSPVYKWYASLESGGQKCEVGTGASEWKSQVFVVRTVVLPMTAPPEVKEATLEFSLQFPASSLRSKKEK